MYCVGTEESYKHEPRFTKKEQSTNDISVFF